MPSSDAEGLINGGRSPASVVAELAALVGGLAHEIRNPLSTIRLNMELLAEDFPEPRGDEPGKSAAEKHRDRRARAKIELVRQECDRLEKLLGDFLDFARQEQLTLEPGSLNVEISQLLDFFAPRADEAGVEVLRYLDPQLPAVMLDRDSFRSAVLNLLINSVQAMHAANEPGPGGSESAGSESAGSMAAGSVAAGSVAAGSVAAGSVAAGSVAAGQLVVRTRPSGRGVLLELIDTGPGMDEETLAKAFTAFFTTKQGGSGLGLPTTRKIVEAHGGSIDVESAPGRGTKVAIWLPVPARLAS